MPVLSSLSLSCRQYALSCRRSVYQKLGASIPRGWIDYRLHPALFQYRLHRKEFATGRLFQLTARHLPGKAIVNAKSAVHARDDGKPFTGGGIRFVGIIIETAIIKCIAQFITNCLP